jgi:hypothetical protein
VARAPRGERARHLREVCVSAVFSMEIPEEVLLLPPHCDTEDFCPHLVIAHKNHLGASFLVYDDVQSLMSWFLYSTHF